MTSEDIEHVKRLAMSDELFEAETLSFDEDEMIQQGIVRKNITVRQKRFNSRKYVLLPSWNEDLDQEVECSII